MMLNYPMQNLRQREPRVWDVRLSTLERSIIIDALYQSIDNAYRTYGRQVHEKARGDDDYGSPENGLKRIDAIEALIQRLCGQQAAQ
jgi:hypothetical protein